MISLDTKEITLSISTNAGIDYSREKITVNVVDSPEIHSMYPMRASLASSSLVLTIYIVLMGCILSSNNPIVPYVDKRRYEKLCPLTDLSVQGVADLINEGLIFEEPFLNQDSNHVKLPQLVWD